MLEIVFDSGNSRQWEIGDKNPVNYDEFSAVNHIIAEGKELNYVRCMFPYVNGVFAPMIPGGKRVILFGDLAKTIVANLTNE